MRLEAKRKSPTVTVVMSKHTNTAEDRILDNWMKYRYNPEAWALLDSACHYRKTLRLLNNCRDLEEAKKIARIIMRERAMEAVSLVKKGRK